MNREKKMLLGDEAIARGAIDAGISGVYAYPGTPSTEITEYIQSAKDAKEKNIHCQWSANEKTAVEGALGMSYAGKRVLSCMKHVGLNVAADAFINSAITGTNGGLVVVSADDPSMHSSQNEQDSRFYSDFALMPTLEPSNQQEAYDMMSYAFDLSEKYKLPVLYRITTRLAHSRAGVVRKEVREENSLSIPKDSKQFVLLPAISRKKYKELLSVQKDLEKESSISGFNKYYEGKNKSLGIIACGIAYNYLMENYVNNECPYSILKIGQYPIDVNMVEKLVDSCDEVLVLEEGMPLVEKYLRGMLNRGAKVQGRMSGEVPREGELNPNIVAKALNISGNELNTISEVIAPRPPALCKGCSHIDSYRAINEAIKEAHGAGHVFADIGCYTLGALPPYDAINTCVDMGASITMAKGAADAGLFPACAVIGDSTFCHSGMTGLLDAVIENSNIIVFVMDNSATAMTGGQDSHALNRVQNICRGIGVQEEHIRVINPIKKNHEEFVKIINEELDYKGVSVIIPTRECMQTLSKKFKAAKKGGKK